MQNEMLKPSRTRAGLALVLAALASVSWAAPADVDGQKPADQPVVAAAVGTGAQDGIPPASCKPSEALGFGQVADLDRLERSRGGTDTHNTANLDGVVASNSAINVVTGNNTIDAGSFANMTGIPVVIQNTGANVLIQSSTIVNVQFK